MKIQRFDIRNFRRLENVTIDVEEDETVFVGPNNSGKTSATAVFRCFLGGKDFKVYDFSVGKIGAIDAFAAGNTGKDIPAIELDLWFAIDPDNISFGTVFSLLPNLSDDFKTVGVRMKYEVRDQAKLLAEYHAAYPESDDGVRKRTLTQYLSIDQNLKRHFRTACCSLDTTGTEVTEKPLDDDESRRMLQSLVRVDFVDAQRNIDDDDKSRSNRLSAAFAAFYRKNLEQAEIAESAHQVIDENNDRLTEHYAVHFKSLMAVIKGLGVPAINDRDLRIVSSLSPEAVLRGNAELYYRDADRNHELPEVYNGLGFKNLIYMAIQISHYHLQWLRTEQNRPLCHLVFVEEPEVHLHAQVQQAFIANIHNIVTEAAKAAGEPDLVPQFVVTTHASHILDAVGFEKVRYFQRCVLDGETPGEVRTLNASKVYSLRNFDPDPIDIDGTTVDATDVLRFLQRYIKLTHCDLFFADAAVMVEGTAEKLLLPRMVQDAAPSLQSAYLTVLEVGGAYAHRFAGLLKFLNIPYVVVTDLDAVEPQGRHAACRGDTPNACTSNATLKYFFQKDSVADLLALESDQKSMRHRDCCVTFQTEIPVTQGDATMIPRTLEEALVCTNLDLFSSRQLHLGIEIPNDPSAAYDAIYKHINAPGFKKTEFALDLLATAHNWTTPTYIAEGLQWLAKRLSHDHKPATQQGE